MTPREHLDLVRRVGECQAYGQATGRIEWGNSLMRVPEGIQSGLSRYVLFGTPTGTFMTNVLVNDLMGAVGHADEWNRFRLWDICNFLHNATPTGCYGSPENASEWIKRGGLFKHSPLPED